VDINTRIALQLKRLREEQGWSIEDLAARSGVSRAMISKIERVESSPTATVLNKLAIGIGTPITTLFGPSGFKPTRPPERNPVALRARQPEWRDRESGYRRKTLTPAGAAPSTQLSEILLPAGCSMTFEDSRDAKPVQRQVWVLEGCLEIRTGAVLRQLVAGDCIAITEGGPATLRNPDSRRARCMVAATG
jgi:transcriptional regulator with XRE-family HTH domain